MNDQPARKATPVTPIGEGIPTDRAWKEGRRIYVRCAYESQLNKQLRDLNAKWDGEKRALWLGSGKADKVIPLVLATVQRVTQIEQIKAKGLWVTIPVEAANIRAAAKDADAVYDGDRKQWAMPSTAVLTEISGQVYAYQQRIEEQRKAQAEQRKAQRNAEKAADREAEQQAAAAQSERVIARSGRTLTGERGSAGGRLHGGKMYREQAEQRKPQPGTVERLSDGRRVLVLSCTVAFRGQDAIDDGFTSDLADSPGWYYQYQYAVVEANAEEQAADERDRAVRADLAEIDAVMRAASRGPFPEVPGLRRLDGPAITADAAGGMTSHGGRITLTADGCIWQHPGFYDSYRAVEGPITDPDLIDRIRAILAGGERRRTQYRVTVSSDSA